MPKKNSFEDGLGHQVEIVEEEPEPEDGGAQ